MRTYEYQAVAKTFIGETCWLKLVHAGSVGMVLVEVADLSSTGERVGVSIFGSDGTLFYAGTKDLLKRVSSLDASSQVS